MRAILVFLFASLFLTACGDGGGGGSSGSSGGSSGGSAPTPTNLTTITIDGSLKGNFNIPTVSLTICPPSSNSASASGCSTISNILVDTGSYGLRIYASVLPSNFASLFPLASPPSGSTMLAQCTAFADYHYITGTVRTVDLFSGKEHARNLPIQVLSDSALTAPLSCGDPTNGILDSSPSSFGTNGVLGIGPLPDDTTTGTYYACSGSTCAVYDNTTLTSGQIVANPIIYFQTDNAGSALVLQSVSGSGQASATGSLIYGIYTASNNTPSASAHIIPLDSSRNFNTRIGSTNYPQSFLDSGSNILFFNDPGTNIVTACLDAPKFYCSTASSIFAYLQGTAGDGQITFSVGNYDTLFASPGTNHVFNNLAGPGSGTIAGNNLSFDWGLPFFFNRTVYTSIQGQTINNISTPTPFYIYQ